MLGSSLLVDVTLSLYFLMHFSKIPSNFFTEFARVPGVLVLVTFAALYGQDWALIVWYVKNTNAQIKSFFKLFIFMFCF